jgi:predicted ArsR family transcriptional regulator
MQSELDQIIHQPIRTKIIALLSNSGECDYTMIKSSLNLTDGHMSTHMKVLVAEMYVEMEKTFVNNKPKTTYKLTKLGKKKFSSYIDALKSIVSQF